MAMNITHFFTYVEKPTAEKTFSIQISSTLVQYQGQNYLFDTGFVNHKEVVYILNKLGLSALDIDFVLNTHLHPDHCGGNRYFRHAQIFISEEDYFFQRDFMHALQEANLDEIESIILRFYPNFNEKQAELFSRLAYEMALLWEDDIVGNTEQIRYIEREWPFDFLEAVPTPGHSIQHYCFRIHTTPKPFLITGDALTTRASFRLNKLDFPYCYDSRAYLQNQKKIGEFHGVIVPGHDRPFDTETLEYLDEEEGGNGKPTAGEEDSLKEFL